MSMTEKNSGTPSSRLLPGEVDIARELQGDIPLVEHPFEQIAKKAGMTEKEALSIVKKLRKLHIIRKFGAIVRHQRAGYTHNVMVLWAVSPSRCREVGEKLASFAEITHCYERTPPFGGKYNLFTMAHFQSEDMGRLQHMAAAVGVDDFKVLRSLEEFKKSSMEYF